MGIIATCAPLGEEHFRRAALDYHDRGIACFPVRGKHPLVRWKPLQAGRLSRREVRALPWGDATGLALIMGAASGGLCCRDFDTHLSYRRWARAHPDLAHLR